MYWIVTYEYDDEEEIYTRRFDNFVKVFDFFTELVKYNDSINKAEVQAYYNDKPYHSPVLIYDNTI